MPQKALDLFLADYIAEPDEMIDVLQKLINKKNVQAYYKSYFVAK